MKTIFAAVAASLPVMAAQAADIKVAQRPAGYEGEKAALLRSLQTEAPLQSQFHRDDNVRATFPETQCTTVDGATGGPKIRETLQVMRDADTLTGPLLRHYMTANDAWYCERPLGNIKANLWGLTYDYFGIVAINEAKPLYRLFGVTAHETLHLMQKARGLSEIDPAGDIYSLQARFLANEASAHALEVAYAYELAQTGDRRAWEGLQVPLIFPDGHQLPSPYLGLQSAFADGYEKSVRGGASHADALRAGGRAAVTAFVTTEQEKLDIYNETVLEVYLSRIGTDLQGPDSYTWTGEKTKLAGKLSESFSLTDGFTLPAPQQRFGKNDEMRWAFEAVELYRRRIANAPDYDALRAQAKAADNPYLDVDMKEALARMPGAVMGASPVRTVSVLNLLSGRTQPQAAKAAGPGGPYSEQRLTALLDKTKAADSACKGGCGVMKMLGRYGIKPGLVTPEQLDILAPGYGHLIVGRQQGDHIYLNGSFGDDKLLETIAHEVRHVWQVRELNAVTTGLDPRRAMIMTRFREADAFAFAAYIIYQYEKATGQTLVRLPDSPMDYGRLPPNQFMYAKFKFNMDCGMSLATSYRFLMKDAFANVRRVDYDGDVLEKFEDQAAKGFLVITPMSDRDFVHVLRQMGTTTLGAGPGVFAVWSDADFLDLEKSGGIDQENLVRLQKLESAGFTAPAPVLHLAIN